MNFITHAAVPLAALALGACALPKQIVEREGRRAMGLLVPAVFFVVAWTGYFAHRDSMWQHAWATVPGAAWALTHGKRLVKLAIAVVALPALVLISATIAGLARVGATSPMRMPNGDTLWLDATGRKAATTLLALLEEDHALGRPATTVVSPSGGGLYFYTNTALPIRHLWIIDKYVRQGEASTMRDRLGDVRHVAFTNETGLTEGRFAERVERRPRTRDTRSLAWTRRPHRSLPRVVAGHAGRQPIAMRVTVLAASGQLGGAERMVLETVRALSTLGLESTVVALEPGPLLDATRREGADMVEVLRLSSGLATLGDAGRSKAAVVVGLLRAAAPLPFSVRRLAGILQRHATDVIHSHGIKTHVLAALVPRRRPVVWHLHDYVESAADVVGAACGAWRGAATSCSPCLTAWRRIAVAGCRRKSH